MNGRHNFGMATFQPRGEGAIHGWFVTLAMNDINMMLLDEVGDLQNGGGMIPSKLTPRYAQFDDGLHGMGQWVALWFAVAGQVADDLVELGGIQARDQVFE